MKGLAWLLWVRPSQEPHTATLMLCVVDYALRQIAVHDAVAAAVRRARAAGGVYGDVEATGVLEERSERRVEELNE